MKTIEISRGKYKKQVVQITEHPGQKNKIGKVYKTSVTKHLSL
jgi:hypothetical protein